MPEDVRLCAGHGFFVWNADDFEWNMDSRLQQRGRARFAKTAVNHMLFHGDDGAAFAARLQNSFGVERLHGVHREDAAIQAALGQLPGGEQRVNDGLAGGDERDVVAFAECDGFADFKLRVRFVQTEHRRFAEANEDGLRRLRRSENRVPRLEVVRRHNDCKIIDRPQHREVVERMMRRAERAVTYTGADADEHGWDVRVTNVILDLLQRTRGEKTRG